MTDQKYDHRLVGRNNLSDLEAAVKELVEMLAETLREAAVSEDEYAMESCAAELEQALEQKEND